MCWENKKDCVVVEQCEPVTMFQKMTTKRDVESVAVSNRELNGSLKEVWESVGQLTKLVGEVVQGSSELGEEVVCVRLQAWDLLVLDVVLDFANEAENSLEGLVET